jgi:serine/threonine protein kinase
VIGKTLGHYKITERIGAGGMGVVYKARDLHLDRFVALKVLPPEKVSDPDRKRRFVQEAKAASALNHPNIVHVYDIDQSDGTDYIAMEYVDGKTLDQRMGRHGLGLSDALKYAVQIADALTKAHSAAIVHRDLKPTNIMVNEDGVVKVLDFGLAKLTEQVQGDETASTATIDSEGRPITEEGVIVGTVAYMSPEQAEGKKVDARSDIFSLGSVLYEMVTGQKAFQGTIKMSTLSAILHQEPKPVSGVTQAIPADFEKLINRCLRKDPAKRLQHMDDVKLALDELKEDSDSGRLQAAPAGAKKTSLLRLVAVAVVVVAFAVAGWYWLGRRHSAEPEIPLTAVPLTSYPGLESSPSFSPDGNQVAFSWNGEKEGNSDIYIRLIGAEPPMQLTTNPANEGFPAWSPDGRWIAFLRDLSGGRFAVVLMPPIPGSERVLLA